ncbi:hypothetical protein AB3G33_13455 [Flavobacterium sp. WC2421]|uniref:Methyltransferase type 11 n=3 Tax=unclassified Flavobacterium TaxID=196869 RepID=A0AB39WA54_9FLAO
MVEVFKTNVQKKAVTNYIISIFKTHFPDYKVNFDLEDCDKILRIEAEKLDSNKIVEYVNSIGYQCIKLE